MGWSGTSGWRPWNHPRLLEKISAAFEAYWESEEFRRFDPDDADEMDVVRRALETCPRRGAASIRSSTSST